ncbi:MAG: hypothetical protein K8I02_08485, partial [Candidatus Methylomirabilis sp.]|nr:hypothetical protein [Deltaproteobacteria bacterium]
MISSEPKDADAERASDRRGHWEGVFEAKDAREVSWFQETPRTSLELIRACGAGPEARIVDVGGGASTLVDRLLEAGYRNVTVLDIARSG